MRTRNDEGQDDSKPKLQQVSAYLTMDVYRRLKIAVAIDGVKMGERMTKLAIEWLERFEKEHKINRRDK
jgi:hypothetical protein